MSIFLHCKITSLDSKSEISTNLIFVSNLNIKKSLINKKQNKQHSFQTNQKNTIKGQRYWLSRLS
jgi:hypothetical protein